MCENLETTIRSHHPASQICPHEQEEIKNKKATGPAGSVSTYLLPTLLGGSHRDLQEQDFL